MFHEDEEEGGGRGEVMEVQEEDADEEEEGVEAEYEGILHTGVRIAKQYFNIFFEIHLHLPYCVAGLGCSRCKPCARQVRSEKCGCLLAPEGA